MIPAVALLSYNRPKLLKLVLQSIVAQQSWGNLKPKFFLAQDFSDSKTCSECIKLAKSYLGSDLTVLYTDQNLGVARNFDRLERMVFQKFNFDHVLFLEDDLVLARHYFDLAGLFVRYMRQNREIGMMSGRGNSMHPSLELQEKNKNKLIQSDEHNWGFVLSKKAWTARQKILRPYLDVILKIHYRTRNQPPYKDQINSIKKSLGYSTDDLHSSQDSMKNAALVRAGFCRLSTFTVNAQYIGVDGEHSDQTKFYNQGHGKQIIFNKLPNHFEL